MHPELQSLNTIRLVVASSSAELNYSTTPEACSSMENLHEFSYNKRNGMFKFAIVLVNIVIKFN